MTPEDLQPIIRKIPWVRERSGTLLSQCWHSAPYRHARFFKCANYSFRGLQRIHFGSPIYHRLQDEPGPRSGGPCGV